jgi:hypothetical protein
MWRIETDRGRFAVKVLNRDFDRPDYVDWYERAFQIEMAALDAGIPMPRPVPVPATGRCLGELPGGGDRPATVRAHEWVAAKPIGRDDDKATAAGHVGEMLAKVHALDVGCAFTTEEMRRTKGADFWRDLCDRATAAHARLGEDLGAALPLIAELEAIARHAERERMGVVMGHRDAGPGNVLVASDGSLLLIDWDSAGPVVAEQEIAKEALVWAGAFAHDPVPSVAHAFVRGYREAGGAHPEPRAEDLTEFLTTIFGWLAFNVRRAIGERATDERDRLRGDSIAAEIIANVPRYTASVDAWVRILREA